MLILGTPSIILGNISFVTSQARGEWIAVLGLDNKVLRTRVHLQRHRFAYPEDVVLFGWSQFIDEEERLKERRAILSFPRRSSGWVAFEKLATATRLAIDAVLIHRSAYIAIDRMDIDMPVVFDWALRRDCDVEPPSFPKVDTAKMAQ